MPAAAQKDGPAFFSTLAIKSHHFPSTGCPWTGRSLWKLCLLCHAGFQPGLFCERQYVAAWPEHAAVLGANGEQSRTDPGNKTVLWEQLMLSSPPGSSESSLKETSSQRLEKQYCHLKCSCSQLPPCSSTSPVSVQAMRCLCSKSTKINLWVRCCF